MAAFFSFAILSSCSLIAGPSPAYASSSISTLSALSTYWDSSSKFRYRYVSEAVASSLPAYSRYSSRVGSLPMMALTAASSAEARYQLAGKN